MGEGSLPGGAVWEGFYESSEGYASLGEYGVNWERGRVEEKKRERGRERIGDVG